MSFPRYAEYKDSCVKELGAIPVDWNILRIKYLTKCLDGQRVPLNAIERGEKKGDIPYWGANKIVDYVNDWLFDEELILLGEDGAPFFDKFKDVAFAVNGRIWPNNHVHVLRPFKKVVNTKFLTYALNCTDYSLYISGSTRDKLNQSDMNNILIRLPPVSEQEAIINFLDHETAKIDNLINQQKKLIELLKEKRQAVISHAVTKGLNPNAPMKDSGVEWLGEVPQGWSLRKLISVTAKIGDGLHGTPKYVDESEYYFINGNNLVDRKIVITDKTRCVSYEEFLTQNYAFNSSTLFLSINGTIGNIAFYNNENLMLGKSAAFIDCKPLLRRDFLAYFFDSNQCQIYFNLSVTGTTISNLGLEVIRSLKVPLPSIQEQTTIVAFLDQETAKIDALITKAESAIQLMQERRTALISAAVTGKIDVRGFVKT